MADFQLHDMIASYLADVSLLKIIIGKGRKSSGCVPVQLLTQVHTNMSSFKHTLAAANCEDGFLSMR